MKDTIFIKRFQKEFFSNIFLQERITVLVILADSYRVLELKVFMRKFFEDAKNNLE